MIETEIASFERAEIRYIKYERRIIRDARLKEFLEFHLDTILEQYAPMLALSDEQMADDQIGGRAGLELFSASLQKQRRTPYTLSRRQFLKRNDADEILVVLCRGFAESANADVCLNRSAPI
jgi:hypothetical protein